MRRPSVLFLLVGALATSAAAGEPRALSLPFIENDHPAALSKAKADARPLFVEVWAPW